MPHVRNTEVPSVNRRTKPGKHNKHRNANRGRVKTSKDMHKGT